jgi:hypothetical protein
MENVSWVRVLVKMVLCIENYVRWLIEDKWTKGFKTTVVISILCLSGKILSPKMRLGQNFGLNV